ncbi:hypothetical protein BGC31_02940 [Komagataeibacter xylinus]|nr:Hydroxyacylglutathione hydrolase [Komagataeibacter xylinus E25]RFP00638.1 hypothetical protein BFX83_02290 [Komagataeibacter xylinus]RFP05904.1 hypothetical protein BGC31_02940 [Komagataeibacter xylinus]
MAKPVATADYVIIGGGASSTLLAWNLARRHKIKALVINPAEHPSLGLAYATPCLDHLLNVAAQGMSAASDEPYHFLNWLRDTIRPDASPDDFVPRAIFGLYLKSLYCEAAPWHIQGEVVSCRQQKDFFHLQLADERRIVGRQVILATGNFDPALLPGIEQKVKEAGRYHHNAWNDTTYAAIENNEPIALIGTGLTAVDVIIRLRRSGHRGQITALSRRGMFPYSHAEYIPLKRPLIMEGMTPATARGYLGAFHAALRAGIDWRAAVDSMRSVSNILWLALPDAEKKRFRRHLQRRWDIVRHRIAPRVAAMLENEFSSGQLVGHKGHLIQAVLTRKNVVLTTQSSRGLARLEAAHVINCTGPSLNYERVGSPLLTDLLDNGLITPGEGGKALRCTPQGQVIDRNDKIVQGLFALGPSRLGILFESIAIPEIRQQASELADYLARVPASTQVLA